jgi:hypothetical protein
MANESAKPHEPTRREQEALAAFFARQKEQKPAPRMTVSDKKGIAQIDLAHPKPGIGQVLLMAALGTADLDFADGLIRQLADASRQGHTVDERGLNFMLAMVRGIEPKDQVETMLAAQMAAVHNATMTFAVASTMLITSRNRTAQSVPSTSSPERSRLKSKRSRDTGPAASRRSRSSMSL